MTLTKRRRKKLWRRRLRKNRRVNKRHKKTKVMAKLYIEDNEARPAVLVLLDTDSPPTGFTEDTTIQGWNKYAPRKVGVVALRDFLELRTKIAELVIAKGFDNCTEEEKVIASQWFVVDKSQRDTVRTEWEQFNDGKTLIYNIRTDNNSVCLFTSDADTKLSRILTNNSGTITVEIL
tara:strand:- start:679 stop:1209 length:531 start_codon:yes stop_codon:yes gene_type:complete